MGEVSLFGFRQSRQLDAVGGIGRQVLGLDRELEHRADELVSLPHPRRAQSLALEAHRPVHRQAGDPHLEVIEPDVAQRHVLPPWQHDGVQQGPVPGDGLG